MRHAKSDWGNENLTDHKRPLNKRGKRDAPIMAEAMLKRGIIPELVLISDSTRTRETWDLISAYFPNIRTIFTNDLYLASASYISGLLQQLDPLIDNVMILGHNPGITEAFEILANTMIDNVPTAGIGCISVDSKKFDNVLDNENTLDYFIYPKMV